LVFDYGGVRREQISHNRSRLPRWNSLIRLLNEDVAIVGAGIVGLGVARELMLRRPGSSVIVVEKESDVAAHQTGHNSGVIHGGIYYTPGSVKARLCVRGAAMMYEYAQEHGIAHEACGKLIVAIRPGELPGLDDLEQRGIANGVPGLRRLRAEEITEIEPRADGVAALHAPRTGIINYPAVARALRRELEQLGVTPVSTPLSGPSRMALAAISTPVAVSSRQLW